MDRRIVNGLLSGVLVLLTLGSTTGAVMVAKEHKDEIVSLVKGEVPTVAAAAQCTELSKSMGFGLDPQAKVPDGVLAFHGQVVRSEALPPAPAPTDAPQALDLYRVVLEKEAEVQLARASAVIQGCDGFALDYFCAGEECGESGEAELVMHLKPLERGREE